MEKFRPKQLKETVKKMAQDNSMRLAAAGILIIGACASEVHFRDRQDTEQIKTELSVIRQEIASHMISDAVNNDMKREACERWLAHDGTPFVQPKNLEEKIQFQERINEQTEECE